MAHLQAPSSENWSGRDSDHPFYWHQNISFNKESTSSNKTFGLLGYACDEGVKRNLGRIGAKEASNAIRKNLGSLAWHLGENKVIDFGNAVEDEHNLEDAHELTSQKVTELLASNYFSILLGGGHDLAYAHYQGIRNYLGEKSRLGILNLDAHFDLRKVENHRTSGTPFYQILEEDEFVKYSCLGIQKASNHQGLFEYAQNKGVDYLLAEDFTLFNWSIIEQKLNALSQQVDHIYLTIDLDGFSSAYAPGVSAPSPLGFHPDVVLKVIEYLAHSQKLISIDVVELNPKYDIDQATARLAAKLVEFICRKLGE